MDIQLAKVWAYALFAAAATTSVAKATTRLRLSRAKHRSLAGHSKMSRRVAAQIPFYEYDENRFFRSDDPPEDVAVRRQVGFTQLSALFQSRFVQSVRETKVLAESISDLKFTGTYRVPFQYSRHVRAHLQSGSVLQASRGVMLEDRDGNCFYDLTGSYGVNVFGYDFYKACIEAGVERARDLGPVLGAYHPSVAYNVRRLREISGLEEVSFHMSGTEAVMQAVRLARYHTGKRRLVRFCGAYHGWWGDVQPGIGNPIAANDTFTLEDMSEEALRVLRTRRDIACILVNPLQALHPNVNAPSDGSLVDSSRRAHFDKAAYQKWLRQLRQVCDETGIVLIFDEVFMGFRLAPRGAQEYFGVNADLVTYGKTVAGGLPIGIVCGRRELMKRFRDERPGDICFARGTFNAHPYVMGAMHEFLTRIEAPEMLSLYCDLDRVWDARASSLNARLRDRDLPVQVANMSTVWTVLYNKPARYNWMFQYYLRAEGLALSWVGTGRLIFSLNYTHDDFEEVAKRFIRAAEAMQRDGWWAHPAESDKAIRRQILKEILACRLGIGRPGIRMSLKPAPADGPDLRLHPDHAAHDADR